MLIPGIGYSVNGSRRWIRLVLFNVQVSEIVRVLVLIFVALKMLVSEIYKVPIQLSLAVVLALLGGATAVERLEGGWQLTAGRLELLEMRLAGEAGVSARMTGFMDLPRQALDIAVALRPPVADAPDIGLRFSGPAATPQRLPDIAPAGPWRDVG